MRCFNKPFHLFPNVTHSAAAAMVACGGCFFLPTPQDPVAAGIGIIFTFRPQTLSNRLLRTCEALVPRRFRPYPLAACVGRQAARRRRPAGRPRAAAENPGVNARETTTPAPQPMRPAATPLPRAKPLAGLNSAQPRTHPRLFHEQELAETPFPRPLSAARTHGSAKPPLAFWASMAYPAVSVAKATASRSSQTPAARPPPPPA